MNKTYWIWLGTTFISGIVLDLLCKAILGTPGLDLGEVGMIIFIILWCHDKDARDRREGV
jgi:hypothetical protein